MQLLVKLLCLFSCSLCFLAASPSQAARKSIQLNQRLPWHPQLKKGQLRNGFKYFLLSPPANTQHDDRISLRLIVNAGAFMEEEQEDGLAHFIEHMVFNGTKNFKPGSLIQYFQRIGMGFGNDTNAFTSATHTVFQLDLPNNEINTLEQGLAVLYDQCFEALFLPQEVNRERGVILSELRARDSIAYREQKAQLQFFFPQHLISKRLVIGTESSINAFQPSHFFNFYQKWYIPQRMTLVAVGDFKTKAIEKLIKDRFSKISRASDVPTPPFGKLIQLPNDQAAISVYTDKELPFAHCTLFAARPTSVVNYHTVKEIQTQYAWNLLGIMLSFRIEKLVKQSNLTEGQFFYSNHQLPQIEAASIEFSAKNNEWENVCSELEKFFRHVNTFGFSQKELDVAKKTMRQSLQEAIDLEYKTSNSQADAMTSAVMSKQNYISTQQALNLYNTLENSIDVTLCCRLWKEMWNYGIYLFVSGNLPTTVDENTVKKLWAASQKQILKPIQNDIPNEFKKPMFGPQMGKIVDSHTYADVGVETLRFKNNVRVNLKPTNFEKNQILISISIGSGILSLPNKSWEGANLLLSSSFVQGGLQQCDAQTLNQLLAGKAVYTDFDVEDDAFVFKASTTREHFEDQINLIGAYIQEPGYRTEAVDLFRRGLDACYNFFNHNAKGVARQKVSRFLANNDPRFGYPDQSILLQRNFDEAKMWLSPIFAKDYIEIAIVGDFNRDELVKILQSTFGALPERAAQKERFEAERKLSWPERPQNQTFYFDSKMDQALIEVVWPTESIWNVDHVRKINILKAALANRLLFKIRQEMGDTYSPQVACKYSDTFTNRGSITAYLVVDPDKADNLANQIVSIAQEIANNGITADELSRAVNPFVTAFRDSLKTNGYWMHIIANAQEYPQKLTWPVNSIEAYKLISCEDVQAMAKLYLIKKNALQVIIKPQPVDNKQNNEKKL